MIIHRRNTFNLKIFRKNFQAYSKLIHFINWPIDFNLKILKDLENLIRPTFSYFSNAIITIFLLSISLFICGY